MNKFFQTLTWVFLCLATSFTQATQTIPPKKGLEVVFSYTNQEKLGAILREFGDTTGIHINAKQIGHIDLKNDLSAMMEINSLPDAVIMPADHLGLHHYFKYSAVNQKLFKANIPERIWNGSLSNGELYGAPLVQGNHLLLFYNSSLISQPAKNWAEMFAQKTELDAKGLSTITWAYQENYWLLLFFSAYGGWPLNNEKIELNTPAMAKALDFYKMLRVKKLVESTCDYHCSVKLFNEEKAAYIITGEWEEKNLYQHLGSKLSVSHLPMIEDKKMIAAFSTQVIAFPNNSLNGSKRDELIQLVNYLQSTKVQQQLWDQIGAIPVEKTAFDYAKTHAKGHLKQTLDLMNDTKPLPADQAMSFIWDAIRKGFMRHQEGVLTSKNTAQYMQELAERNIRNAEK